MRQRDFIIFILSFLLVFPLFLMKYQETGIPLADIVCVVGFFCFIKKIVSIEAGILAASIFLAFFSIFIAIIFYPNNVSFRNIFSLIFFFKPLFAYFAAAVFIKNFDELKRCINTMSMMAFFLVTTIIFSIILFHHSLVRAESELNGSFFGLPLFGAYGVNSLAAFYVVIAFVVLMAYYNNRQSPLLRIIFFISFLECSYLVLASLSRMAILGYFLILFFIYKSFFLKYRLIGIAIAFVTVLSVFFITPPSHQAGFGEAKLNQIESGWKTGNFDYISSGRLTLYSVALSEISHHPFIGSYFGGFQTGVTSIKGFDSVEGLSPHNQYITAIWKMGIPGGLLYLSFLIAISLKLRKQANLFLRLWGIRFVLFMLIILCNLWDVLMIPNVGALFFFIIGACTYGGAIRREA